VAETLEIAERDISGMAAVMSRNGIGADAIGLAIGLDLPDGPAASGNGEELAIGTGPGTWLIVSEGAGCRFAENLQDSLRGLASVSDQSSGYAVFRLSGSGARTILQRGAAIDLHPSSFGPGSAAVTVIAHIGLLIWQVNEQPAFDVAVFRSFSRSFRDWLDEAARAL